MCVEGNPWLVVFPLQLRASRRVGAETHQLFELPLPVAELLVHPEADLRALQRGDDLQLRVFVLDDVVLQHQTQDLHRNTSLPAASQRS